MKWRYRTILFEFQKDGLLGDRYIDDDEMENILNEEGSRGWELVSVTPVQEGLLAFLKRPEGESGRQATAVSVKPAARPVKTSQAVRGQVQSGSETKREDSSTSTQKNAPKKGGVGGIKIS